MSDLLRPWLVAAACVVVSQAPLRAEQWETLENCRLSRNESNDGDSFHVEHKGKEYIFRLYFVDAPETSEQIPSRVTEQAEVFGVPRDRLLEAGKEAAAFTANQLRKSFTVQTMWQDAEGMSRLPRYYAFIETADGKDLGELLAGAGYARSFGVAASIGGRNESFLRGKYDRLAERAERAKLGAWGSKRLGSAVVLEDNEGSPEESAARAESGSDSELGMTPGMPSMDSLTETLRIDAEPVVELP